MSRRPARCGACHSQWCPERVCAHTCNACSTCFATRVVRWDLLAGVCVHTGPGGASITMKTKHHDRLRRASRFVATRVWLVAAVTLVATGLVAAVDAGAPAHFRAGAVEVSDAALTRGAIAHTRLPVGAEMVGFNW